MKPKKTVLLGLSGGVDSSVSALLLKKQRYNVIGAFLKMYSNSKNPLTGECSYLEDLKMAKKIAILLKIPLIILDYEKEYKSSVLKPMFKYYKSGLTPNPDISCNKIIKFPLLWKKAKQINASFIATGHYARIKKISKEYTLLTGKDKLKDQSYFLSELSRSDLSHTLFPLGNLTKKQVRKIAKENNFPNWDKHGTIGICFVGQKDMQSLLKTKIKPKIGKVLSPDNNILGTHQGISFYTIGQKANSNIGINIKKPSNLAQKRFYIAKKIKPNTLVVAPENHPLLKRKSILLKSLHLINPNSLIPANLQARIRHLGFLHKGRLIKKKNKYLFIFQKPVDSIAEGQYLVIYHKDKLLASGEMRLS